jgi:ABC-type bacteriocin/lantibiotic exporter with double-glycine peptidase domain
MIARLGRRVPIVLQMSPVECGAACLAMILGYHGRKTRVAECRERLGIGRDGANALQISRAAKSYGLRTRSYSLEPAALRDVRLPAIVHWRFNHFVVLEKWTPNGVVIVDPAFGRRTVTADEFDSGFTGVVLVLEPGAAFETSSAAARLPGGYYIRFFTAPGSRGVWLQILAASLVLQVFGLATPLLTKLLVDTVLPGHIDQLMGIIAISLMLLVAGYAVTAYLRAGLLLYLQARLDSQIMLGFFEHVLRLPYPFFQQRTTGDLLMRLSSNIAIRETLTNQVISTVLDGAFVVIYLVALFALEPRFATAALLIGIVQVGVMLGTGGRLREETQHELAAATESQTYLIEALSGIAVLKASGAEDGALEHWSNLFFRHLNSSLRKNHLSAIIGTVMVALRIFSSLFLLWLAALQVLEGAMTMGMMLAINAMSHSFLSPLASLVGSAQQLFLVRAHLDRISDVLAAEPEPRAHTTEPARLSGRIDVRDLSFRYDSNGPLVLRDLSFTIEPGQKVAFVGRSGSGKSTLAKLLLGFYKPEAGEIYYDGRPYTCLDVREMRRQFGVVLQEPALFSGSIRDNIAFHDLELPLDRVMEAARTAQIHDDIARLPMRYETVLIEGGASLSGGQRQRIAIARALVHRPAVLLLDEATSHLDVVTESALEENLSRLGCTRIAIAHRLSTIADADMILVLDGGTIVERGTHEELLARNGYYAEMIASPAAAAALGAK